MPFVSLANARAPLTLAIDAGTSSVRALTFDGDGNAVVGSEEQITYALETTADGGAFFPAERLFEITVLAIDGAVGRLGAHAADVTAVGTTSFWHSLLGVDGHDQPTTPVLYWADTRSASDAHTLRAELDAESVWQRTGCRLHPSYWPAKLRWLARIDPNTFSRTVLWRSFPEYALGRLCGAGADAVTICMASGTGLLDVHTLAWDREILEACDINSSQLSPLVDLGPPGRLREEFSRRWPALATAHWFPALGDGACANVGSGAIGPAQLALTVGTSAAVRMILPRPAGSDWTIPPGLWAYRLDSRRAVLGGALSNGGNLLRWIWNTTGSGPADEVTVEATLLAPDATGLTFLPLLAGERSPGWYDDASGVIAGLTLATAPQDLIRAGMESVAYRLASIYDTLRPLADSEHAIIASGGAILAMPSWLQIIADTLGHPLTAIDPVDETTARGAALMAAVECGNVPSLDYHASMTSAAAVYQPNREHHAAYRIGRERLARLEATLAQTGEFL
jgi:gluconokinase